jgi:hypothetical protein
MIKNKILTGVPAVSRHHLIWRIFPDEDSPDFDQHDFPEDFAIGISPTREKNRQQNPDGPIVRLRAGQHMFSHVDHDRVHRCERKPKSFQPRTSNHKLA